ncbi:MAG: hypothetical protein J5525_13360 [Lachnospiraceae bacterium]|nr:hypothetical protein [Lachnospiraceae bacterium]
MSKTDTQRIYFLMVKRHWAYDSEIVLLTTDPEQVKKAIISKLKERRMSYRGKEEAEMVKNFENDWGNMTVDEINAQLEDGNYGYGIAGRYGKVYGRNCSV